MFLWQRSSWSKTFHPKNTSHKLYDPSCDHWQEKSEGFPEVMPSKRVKAALRSASVRQCRSTCLFMCAYIHKQALLLPAGQEVSAAWQQVHTGLFCQNKSFIQKIQSLKLRTRGAATEHVETRRGGAQRHTDDKARLLREFRATASSAELVTLLPSLSKRHQPAWCPTPQRAKLFTPSCSGRSIIDADSSNKTLTSDQSVQRPLMFKSARHSDRYRPYACSDTTKA